MRNGKAKNDHPLTGLLWSLVKIAVWVSKNFFRQEKSKLKDLDEAAGGQNALSDLAMETHQLKMQNLHRVAKKQAAEQ